MYKREIKVTDLDGVERVEICYFNLTKAEIMEMELSYPGGLSGAIRDIVATQKETELIKIFKDLILRAYGVKSADGRYIEKSEALSERFSHTEAYSILFMELATNADKAAEFINGITPSDIDTSKIELDDSLLPKTDN